MFGVTSPYLAPQYGDPRPADAKTIRSRRLRRALPVIVAGGACVLLAACSSSSSSSTSAPAATSSAPAVSTSAPATASTSGAVTSSVAAIPAADCTIIKQVDSSAITTLAPLQTDSAAQQAAAIKKYVSTLTADEAKLASSTGKATLTSWISAVKKSSTESTAAATTTITNGLGDLGKACP